MGSEKLDKILLKYDGNVVANGTMDAFLVAERISSFAELISLISYSIYRKEINIKVTSPKKGSFGLLFYLGLAEVVGSLLFHDLSVVQVLKTYIEIVTIIKGDIVKDITNNHGKVTIHTNNKDISGENINITNNIYIFNDKSDFLNLLNNPKISELAYSSLAKPIIEDGLSAKISDEKNEIQIDEGTAECIDKRFRSNNMDDGLISEQTEILELLVISPDYRNERNWIFFDKSDDEKDRRLAFEMRDEAFVKRNSNIGLYDFIKAEVLIREYRNKGRLKIKRKIQKVIKYVPSKKQQDLFS